MNPPSPDRTKISTHIQKNLIPISNQTMGRRCGDGRDNQSIAEAIFGADLGYLYAAIAAMREVYEEQEKEIDAQKILYAVDKIVSKETDGVIFVHTDNHNDPGAIAAGCGFNKLARTNLKFGLRDQDFRDVDSYLLEKQASGKLNHAVYTGAHTETSVLIIHSSDYSVKASDPSTGVSTFVLQKSLVDQECQLIAEELGTQFSIDASLLFDTLHRWLEKQTEETRLALAKDLPIYTVYIDKDGTANFQE